VWDGCGWKHCDVFWCSDPAFSFRARPRGIHELGIQQIASFRQMRTKNAKARLLMLIFAHYSKQSLCVSLAWVCVWGFNWNALLKHLGSVFSLPYLNDDFIILACIVTDGVQLFLRAARGTTDKQVPTRTQVLPSCLIYPLQLRQGSGGQVVGWMVDKIVL
jgi:hypothetical protein